MRLWDAPAIITAAGEAKSLAATGELAENRGLLMCGGGFPDGGQSCLFSQAT